jgi:hypothetical protein
VIATGSKCSFIGHPTSHVRVVHRLHSNTRGQSRAAAVAPGVDVGAAYLAQGDEAEAAPLIALYYRYVVSAAYRAVVAVALDLGTARSAAHNGDAIHGGLVFEGLSSCRARKEERRCDTTLLRKAGTMREPMDHRYRKAITPPIARGAASRLNKQFYGNKRGDRAQSATYCNDEPLARRRRWPRTLSAAPPCDCKTHLRDNFAVAESKRLSNQWRRL